MLDDLRYVYGKAIQRIGALLPSVWAFPVAFLAYYAINGVVLHFVSSLPSTGSMYAGGWIMWVIHIAEMAHFAGLMSMAFRYRRLKLQDLLYFNGAFFASLSQVQFVLYLVSLLLGRLGLPSQLGMLWHWGALLASQLVAPTFEGVYIGEQGGLEALIGLGAFWKSNVLQWLPVALVGILFQIALPLSDAFSAALYAPEWALQAALCAAVYSFVYLLRGCVYIELNGSTPRSRAFQRRART